MAGQGDGKKEGLANASVSTSVRGGKHDGESDGSTPRNLGLPGDDHRKGLERTQSRGAKPSEGDTERRGN